MLDSRSRTMQESISRSCSRTNGSYFIFIFLLTLQSIFAINIWEEWRDHRYFFSEKLPEVSAMSYPQASAYCEEIGGHLASSTSEEENRFLVLNKVQLHETCWLGLYIEESEMQGCDSCVSCSWERFLPESQHCDLCNSCRNAWKWEDGSNMTWWRWHHAQPDDQFTCARMHGDGKWYDDDCDKDLCFVCKQSVHECVPMTECGENGFWNCRTKLCTCTSGYWGEQCDKPPTTTTAALTTMEITTESHITSEIPSITSTKESHITTEIPRITTTKESHITTEIPSITTTKEFADITTNFPTSKEQSITTQTLLTETNIADTIKTTTDFHGFNGTHDRQREWQVFGLGNFNSIIIISIVSLLGIIVFLVGLLLFLKSRKQLYKDDGSGASSLLSFIKGSHKSDQTQDDQYIDAFSEQVAPHESFVSNKPGEDIGTKQEEVHVVHTVTPVTPYAVTDLCDSLCNCTKCQACRYKPLFKTPTPIPQCKHYRCATLEGTKVVPKKPPRKFHNQGLNYIQSNSTWEDAYYFRKPALAFNSHTTQNSRPLRLPRYDDMRQECYTDRSDSDISIMSVYDVPKHPRKVTTAGHRRTGPVSIIDESSEERDYFPVEIHPNLRDLANDSSIMEDVYAVPLKTSTMEHSPPKKPTRKKGKAHQQRLDAVKGEFDSSGIWYTTY